MDIAGTVALVTGASSGIGAATATHLASRGATVVAVARRADRLDAVVEQCRARTPASIAIPADLSTRAACEGVVAAAVAERGRVDILVNNAGIPMRRHADDLTVEDVERVMDLNFRAPVWLTLALLPAMRSAGRGAIVNVTSLSAAIPVPRAAAYGASKAALTRWTHGLAIDLAGTGVQVSVVSPGPIATEIWQRGHERNRYAGRVYPPEVVAEAIEDAIVSGRVQQTTPRQYGLLGAVYPIMGVGRLLRWGLRRFAPPPDADLSQR